MTENIQVTVMGRANDEGGSQRRPAAHGRGAVSRALSSLQQAMARR